MARAVALALLVVLSECSIVAGPGTPTDTLTPVPVGGGSTVTPSRASLGSTPPGVVDGDLVEPMALAAAHVTALSDHSFTIRRDGVQRHPNGTIRTATTVRVQVASPARYRYSVGFVGDVERFGTGASAGSLALWANGSAVYRRRATGPYPAVTLLRHPWGEPVGPLEVYHGEPLGGDRLRRLLGGATNVTVAPWPRAGVYRVRIHGWNGDALATPGGLVRNASVKTAVLDVAPSGLVRRASISYAGTVDGRRVEGRFSTRYLAVGETTVDRPLWVTDAAPGPSPTPNGTATASPTPAVGGRVTKPD